MSSPYQPYPQDSSGGYGQPPQGGWDPSQRGYLQGGPVGFGEAISEGSRTSSPSTAGPHDPRSGGSSSAPSSST